MELPALDLALRLAFQQDIHQALAWLANLPASDSIAQVRPAVGPASLADRHFDAVAAEFESGEAKAVELHSAAAEVTVTMYSAALVAWEDAYQVA